MLRILLLSSIIIVTTNIYTITVDDIDGNDLSFAGFEGKKILIVNTATNSRFVQQYAELEQLHQLYGDSLVIIVFPSNSFGNEPGTNQEIKSYVTSQFNIHYKLAAKVDVTGSSQSEIYQWLTQMSQNGMMNTEVMDDFQKFLVNKEGKLIGLFSPLISPMDSIIQNAITQ